MKKSLTVLALFFGSLTQAATYTINPFSVPEQCLSNVFSRVTDHRVNPPRTFYRYFPSVKPCASLGNAKRISILNVNGSQWSGVDGNVQIRDAANRCLTNPADYTPGGRDTGELRWDVCRTPAGLIDIRQQWYLTRNAYGATRIASQLQFVLRKPNAQLECMERVNPTQVKRVVGCTLGNWQVRNAN